MKIEVHFTSGSKEIHLNHVSITGDEAVRVPLTHRGKLYEVLIWEITPGNNLTILLLPKFLKRVWRWSGTLGPNHRWQKIMPSENAEQSPWSCRVRWLD